MPRTDIQGLRAIAVLAVVVYHLWPASLPGGFVGVDVFFVISGYLITLHLLQRPPSRPRDLAEFWGRRVRRLLPASLFVLLVTLVASRLIAPVTTWETTARDAAGATVYAVNWVLAGDAVDYLAADDLPSPLQHFWSLSVEEQFYLAWPVLFLVLGLLARRTRRGRALVEPAVLTLVVAASFAYSVHITAVAPAAAYFVTPARAWELGIGGLLAAAVHHGRLEDRLRAWGSAGRSLAATGGLLMIGWAVLTYSSSTPFPGWQAAVPVLGTAIVIAMNCTVDDGPVGRLLARPAMQWTADVSYSIYLWHWPLIILASSRLARDLRWWEAALVGVVGLLAAWATKVHVEDRFRGPHWSRSLRRTFTATAVGMLVVLLAAGAQIVEVRAAAAQERDRLERALAQGGECFGADALRPGADCPTVPLDQALPALEDAGEDKSDAYDVQADGADCWSSAPGFRDRTCTFGRRDADTTIALVGNSHAGQWLPALQRLADQEGWRIRTHLASQCAAADLDQAFPTPSAGRACRAWVQRTTQRVIDEEPDVVVYTNRVSVSALGADLEASYPLYGDGMREVLERWSDAGLRVLALHDTPASGEDTPDCLAARGSADDCAGTREDWIAPEPVREAVAAVDDPRIRFADLNDSICRAETCDPVVGGVVVYFDASHLTATYATTLAPVLRSPLRQALAASP